ncbi:glucose dehydrogenase [Trichonephila clavipes]|nr:glucose dehydrogenase [Trichonephila clavipes]
MAEWLAHRASTPQVRGSNPELGKTKRKLDLTGASEINRLYPNSRRKSIKENQYLNTLPAGEAGGRKRPNENETEICFPVFAVGGGSSGAVIASRLSEDPNVKVLLLEAGGPENQITDVPLVAASLQQTPVDWAYQTEPQEASCFGLKGRV